MLFLFFVLSAHTGLAQQQYLMLTAGGGIVGTALVYKIGYDGVVLKGRGIGNITFDERAKLKRCVTRKYFRKTRSLLSQTSGFDHPGNVYSSISLFEDQTERRITWGDVAYPAPANAQKLSRKINSKLATLTFEQAPSRE